MPLLVKKRFGELPAGRDGRDLFGQRGLRFVGEHCGDVLQRIELLMHLGIHLIVAVADADGDDSAEEIQVLVAVGIPDILIFRVRRRPAAP